MPAQLQPAPQMQSPPQADAATVRIHVQHEGHEATETDAAADADSHSSQPGLPSAAASSTPAVDMPQRQPPLAALSNAELAAALASARSSVDQLTALMAARGNNSPAAGYKHHGLVRTHSSHSGCRMLHEDRGVDQTFHTVVPLRELLGPNESPDPTQFEKIEALTGLQIESKPTHPPRTGVARFRYSLTRYFRKFGGQHVSTPPMVSGWSIVLSFMASFVGIAVPALMHYNLLDTVNRRELFFLIPSLGATAVLLYGVPQSDLAQPRNVLVGHIGSAIIGILVRLLIPMPHAWGDPTPAPSDPVYERFLATQWLACALAVSLSIAFMALARSPHPPGGATALIPNMIAPAIQKMQWQYVGFVGATASIMVLIALIFNNMPRKTVWPKYWI